MKQQFFNVRRKLNRETFFLYSLFFLTTSALLGLFHLIFSKINWEKSYEEMALVTNETLKWDSQTNAMISASFLTFILSCYAFKYYKTRRGDLIAKQMGGIEITNNLSNPYYRAFNHAITEMSITANIPPPRAFIMPHDDSINAFAAGTTEQDSVIAITQGALKQLTPLELKALVAHEVSHIANGDTKMNRRITAVIYGFMSLTAISYLLFKIADLTNSATSKSSKNNVFIITIISFIMACFIYLMSKILEVFGKIIQSLLSRKREYYADSQAIVSMRLTLPIYSLLTKLNNPKSIQPSLRDKASPEYQHFYFHNFSKMNLMATHPPLHKRIEAVQSMMTKAEIALSKKPNKDKTLYELHGDNWS